MKDVAFLPFFGEGRGSYLCWGSKMRLVNNVWVFLLFIFLWIIHTFFLVKTSSLQNKIPRLYFLGFHCPKECILVLLCFIFVSS